MMSADRNDDREREVVRSDAPSYQALVAARSLQEHGVDVTGSESMAELSLMQAAVEAFRRAAEALGGRAVAPADDALSRQVIPPRAADETARQYAERVNRMADRFRSLAKSPGRERGTR